MRDRHICKAAAIVCGAVLMAACCGAAYGDARELLRNRSFEEPLDPGNWGCDMAAGWIRWGNWMNRETGWAPTRDGECLIGFHHWRLKGPDNAGFYQDVERVERGKEYVFSIYTWADKGMNTAETVTLELQSWHGGTVLTSQSFRIKDLEPDKWNRLSVTVRAPDAAGLRVVVFVEPKERGKRNHAVKFDQASLQMKE